MPLSLSYGWATEGWFIPLLLDSPCGAGTPSEAICHHLVPHIWYQGNWVVWFPRSHQKLLAISHMGISPLRPRSTSEQKEKQAGSSAESSTRAKVGIDDHWNAGVAQGRLCAGTSPLCSQCIPEPPQFLSMSDYPSLPFIAKGNIGNAKIYFCLFCLYPTLPLS